MPDNYFKKFPLINYNNYLAVNITERAVVTNDAFKNPYLFYKYDLSEGERPDQLSDRYYNDQFMDWVLYLSNKTTDPYYGWYLDDKNFNNFIVKKYNTDISILQSRIAFYRNNWYENDIKISTSEYAALSNNVHRYWQPYYNNSATIAGYERVKEDWVINTNAVRKYTANSSYSFSNFIKDEIIDITFDSSHKGIGQVVISNSSSMTLKNISGTTLANSTVVISSCTSYMEGRSSNYQALFDTAVSVANNIALDETIYWSPVSVYDSERELNEQNKSINVLDSSYSKRISKEITTLLK